MQLGIQAVKGSSPARDCRLKRLRGFESHPSFQFQRPRGRAVYCADFIPRWTCERPEGPNPSGAAIYVSIELMKKKIEIEKRVLVEEKELDAVLSKLLSMDPMPMKKIKTPGKRGSKSPLFSPQRSK